MIRNPEFHWVKADKTWYHVLHPLDALVSLIRAIKVLFSILRQEDRVAHGILQWYDVLLGNLYL